MSAILALIIRTGQPVDHAIMERMLEVSPERGPDGFSTWVDKNIALAHQHFWITPEEQGECQPIIDPSGRYVITADVRLDNRRELAALLKLDPPQVEAMSDAVLILNAYQAWGSRCVDHLLGDFAFAIWDALSQQLFLARDALGNRDLAYYIDKHMCVAASEVSQVLAHPGIQPRLNEGKIAEWLTGLWDNQAETFYQEIQYLPPAHYLIITSEHCELCSYWDINPDARIVYADDRQYAEHYLELLTEVVRSRLRSISPLAVTMSGGLDSTSLAALAAGLLPQSGLSQRRLKTYSYAFNDLKECDERLWIQPVVDDYQLDAIYIGCDDLWTLRDLDEWPLPSDYIISDSYAWLPDAIAKRAGQDGCRLLLGGYYGDTLFGGGYYWAADLMRQFRWGKLIKTAFQHWQALDWRLDLVDYDIRPLIPDGIKRFYRRFRPRPVYGLNPVLHPDFIERTHLHERKNRSETHLRSKFTAPGQWSRYAGLFHNSTAQGAAATRRLYNRHGVELEAPYQDRRLVEFVMALPADQLYQPGRDRWVHRNAMSGLLPEEVRERTLKTSFVPLFKKGIQEEAPTIKAFMSDPQIIQRHIVLGDWLDNNISGFFSNAQSGATIWPLLCLELWLQRYFPQA